MSRVGKKVIELPVGVSVSREGHMVHVKGPKGELSQAIDPAMEIKIDGTHLTVKRPSESKEHRSLHGLSRSLIANMVEGVTNGFEKKLEIRGIGYRAEMRGNNVLFNLGFSHPIILIPPKSITVKAEANTSITVSGIDKELVGHVAAKIRTFRKPEPYKGKGIRYVGEYVREKAGKTAGK
ncbi:MAG: 50S ribosomal protein L6 [Deferribacteres bacterium]|nr:50S ribosomal protein L6 [candidate division KSB1 bacterium]MCB9502650.1 50S ribosomal protein L6 [Deferribacteres bacterium]